jgi:hypothetical protein
MLLENEIPVGRASRRQDKNLRSLLQEKKTLIIMNFIID